jgi:hypothetical protein
MSGQPAASLLPPGSGALAAAITCKGEPDPGGELRVFVCLQCQHLLVTLHAQSLSNSPLTAAQVRQSCTSCLQHGVSTHAQRIYGSPVLICIVMYVFNHRSWRSSSGFK